MRLTKNQIEHLAYIILKNLTKEGKILAEDKTRLLEEITSLILEEFQKEDKLDQEVREILSKHMDKIRKENIEYQTLFRMIKTKLAKEKNLVLSLSNRLSREKINFFSRQILTALNKNEQVEFLDDPNEIRLIVVQSIEEEIRLYESLDKKAVDKIQSQKKPIEEGSREWDILYRKYYNEELAKLGKVAE